MALSKLDELAKIGQSIWLDNISRSMIESGKLKEEINLGLRGMTSNPSIFDNSISSSADYDEAIKKLAGQGKSTFEIYDDLTIRDVQDAADMFRPVYDKTGGLDGYVSLEINPELAMKTQETIEEGQRLYKKVNRPNVMFKVPSTDAGFEAISELLGGGININVTLIFSLEQYVRTAHAYIEGMKRLLARGGDMSKVHSVASVFVSRIDTAIDKMIDARSGEEKLKSFRGKAAVANSKLIFSKYHEIFSGNEFLALKDKGANLQRVLWGSTGTKDPSYSDIKYVTELIGNPTVNTLPDKTLAAFMDHGVIKETITKDAGDAGNIIENLKGFGIDVNEICLKLLDDGVAAFQKSFESLLNAIETKKK
ncbi:MAG: transaldolase [Nitrospirae bacterium]|nr:transaldolase [Nitrospirota bacterium]